MAGLLLPRRAPDTSRMDYQIITPYKNLYLHFSCAVQPLSQGTAVLPWQGTALMINRVPSSPTAAVPPTIPSFCKGLQALYKHSLMKLHRAPREQLNIDTGQGEAWAHPSSEPGWLQPSYLTCSSWSSITSHGPHALHSSQPMTAL